MTTEHDTLLKLCSGNADAVALIRGAWRFAEVYDDAIDGQKRESDAAIHAGFHWALFDLHRNQFYVEHREALDVALATALADWTAATALERSGEREQLVTAYTLRCSPYSFFVAVVYAASGMQAAAQAAIYFRSRPSSDRLDDYLLEHNVKD